MPEHVSVYARLELRQGKQKAVKTQPAEYLVVSAK